MTAPLVVRASSLPGYQDCPRRTAARVFRREVEAAGYALGDTPLGIGAVIGTSVHRGASLSLEWKARTGNLPATSASTDAAIETLREQLQRGVTFDKEADGTAAAEKQVWRMTASYLAEVAPTVVPIIVETRLEVDTGLGFILSGQSDVIAREPGRVRDLKTGKKRGNYKPQIGAYSLLARAHGMDIKETVEDFVQRVPLSRPQPFAITVPHDLAAAETAAVNVLRHMADDLRVFTEGSRARRVLPGDPWAFPANPSSMLCGAKYCPAHGTAFCREHQETL